MYFYCHKDNCLIKYKLVQSFLLVILFSYQQIVTWAFTLVKCINIGNVSSLYVQGNIQCFTQWQTAIEIFIWANIFPSFFILSHVPYYVEMNQMSVPMFILVCLIPVPGLMLFHVPRFWNKFKTMFHVQNESDIELNRIVEREKPLQLDQMKVNQEKISSRVTGLGSTLSLSDTLGIISNSDIDKSSELPTGILSHLKSDSERGTLADMKQSKIRVLTEINPQEDEQIFTEAETSSKRSIEETITGTDQNSKYSSELVSEDEVFVDSKDAITEILLQVGNG